MSSPTRTRWRPTRAGILNVYQYEDETLHFADGRLLLRGVNGSGKSTAMNMLLPFLLEADTRRIDAAGDQVGVLKSWMLAGTDETQRTGYLWLEFQRPDDTAAGGVRLPRDRVRNPRQPQYGPGHHLVVLHPAAATHRFLPRPVASAAVHRRTARRPGQ